MRFQRRYWAVQRVGWAVIALLLLCALLGLFGSGVFGTAVAGGQGAQPRVEYERFGRAQAEAALRIQMPAGAARVWLSREYLDRIQILQITPEPESVETAGDRVSYTFRVADPSQPASVTFHFEPERAGRLRGRAGLAEGGAPPLEFTEFVYP